MLVNQELENKTDIELYEQFLSGDDSAFEEIMNRYTHSLISFISRYIVDLDIAEDLAQDTFVYVLMNKKNYNSKFSLKSYLFLIAKCRAMNYLKLQKRKKAYIENYIINTEDFLEIDEDLLQEESKKKIYFALNKLKKEYKIVIYLKDIHGFKIKEISTILNKTVPHTKVLVHRARKALAKELGKEGYVC